MIVFVFLCFFNRRSHTLCLLLLLLFELSPPAAPLDRIHEEYFGADDP